MYIIQLLEWLFPFITGFWIYEQVLWPECAWQPVSLTDIITSASVKKVYRKATLCIHPDKVQQKGATLEQRYTAEKVFDILKVRCVNKKLFTLLRSPLFTLKAKCHCFFRCFWIYFHKISTKLPSLALFTFISKHIFYLRTAIEISAVSGYLL